jgi:hypothetical protein
VSERSLFPLAGLLLLAASTCSAQQFNADIVRLKPAGGVTTRVSVKGDRARMEVLGQSTKSYVLLDLSKRQSIMVLPDTKTYIVSPPGRISSSVPMVRIGNPDEACVDWVKDVSNAGECKKIGDDDWNGRKTVKYTATASNGDTGTVWIDRELKVPIKWDGEKSAAEMQNIKLDPIADSLFNLPTDYEKIDVAAKRESQRGKKKPPMPPRN